jgi:ribosomal protein S18 acetylase RimI-like enzyme
MTGSFRIESLSPDHDRAAFSCGVAPLDRYLREQASQDMRRLVSNCFVLIDSDSLRIAGYYTLAATSIPTGDLPADMLRKLPRYPLLPAALMGRLAVDTGYRRQGLGGLMLAEAATRILHGDLPALALIVDAKDDNAVAFYEAHGFRRLASRPTSLYLPLATFRKAAGEP